MTIGLAFWVIWLILVVFFFALHFGVVSWALGLDILVLLLVTILGWQVFGPPLHR